jgi:hypothetical protein
MNLKKNLAANMRERHKDGLGRCDNCSWPLAESAKDGCVAGNCSMRPLPLRDDTKLRADFRALLAFIESYAC